MNDSLKWLKEPGNMRKTLMFLFALNLMVWSVLLFITASGQGALYEAIKPSVVTEKYTLLNQYVGDIVVGTTIYQDILIFDVVRLDDSLNEIGDPHKVYFAKEHVMRYDLQDGDIIVCSWLVQVIGEKQITSVVRYDTYNQINCSLLNFY